jgi:ATP-dependent DNA helicase DinG
MEVKNFLSAEVVKYMKSEIEKADGNEVFFTGQIDSTGLVISVKVGARGNQNTVLVNQNDVRESSVIIHNHPGGNLQPSSADLSVASRASDNAQGFYIVNNEVSKIYVVIKPILPSVIKNFQKKKLVHIFRQVVLLPKNLNILKKENHKLNY